MGHDQVRRGSRKVVVAIDRELRRVYLGHPTIWKRSHWFEIRLKDLDRYPLGTRVDKPPTPLHTVKRHER